MLFVAIIVGAVALETHGMTTIKFVSKPIGNQGTSSLETIPGAMSSREEDWEGEKLAD